MSFCIGPNVKQSSTCTNAVETSTAKHLCKEFGCGRTQTPTSDNYCSVHHARYTPAPMPVVTVTPSLPSIYCITKDCGSPLKHDQHHYCDNHAQKVIPMPVTTPTTPKTTSSTGPPSIKQQHRQAKSLKRCGAAGCTDVVVSNTMTCARHADPVEKPVVAPKAEFTHDDLLRAMINVEDVLGADDKNVQVLNDFIMRVVAADKKAEKRLKKKQDKIKKLKKRLAKVNQQTARVYLAARDN